MIYQLKLKPRACHDASFVGTGSVVMITYGATSNFKVGIMMTICLQCCTLHIVVGGGWVATFNHIGKSFNLFVATTRGVWIIPSFQIGGSVLYIEHISCLIMACGLHQPVISCHFSITFEALLEENVMRKLLSPSLDLFFKMFLFQVTFPVFFSIAIVFSYVFRLVCCCNMWLCFSQVTS